jgi:2'-5' RNA ligase superfamily
MDPTYILTAEMDAASFAWLDALRRTHFPPERNFLPAHISMFHLISPEQAARLHALTLPPSPLAIRFDGPLLLGFGVAIGVQSGELKQLRTVAMTAMGGEFSGQDRQPWRPHVTIQNKVSAQAARDLDRQMRDGFVERAGTVTGLLLWAYLGGPWRLAERLPFGG